MTFITFEFFLFFTLVLFLNWYLKKWPLAWRLFLLASSYYFYSFLDLKFLLIIFSVSIFNFLIGLSIPNKKTYLKKLILTLGIIVNLSVLGVFKYYDFFRVSVQSILSHVGLPASIPFLDIALPIGLSFYIFRVISYIMDIYRGKTVPASLLDFLIYVSFFPQLLSGPIARAGDFISQLKGGGTKGVENLPHSITLIMLGLFKKLIISSYLVLNLTDDFLAVSQGHSSLGILLAIFAYSMVIYFDFSGYSDMAVGFAGLMGFKSPINFNTPYLATNIQDFWRRWHISLSDWVRDYIYIPLGGNRVGKIRQYANLMITMLLVGLWHGPAAHYVVWGGIQGAGLVGTLFFQSKNKEPKKKNLFLGKILPGFLTFCFVTFSWVFFRSESIKDALLVFKNIFVSKELTEYISPYVLLFIALGIVVFLLEKQIVSFLTRSQAKLPLIFFFIFVILSMTVIFYAGPNIMPPFIYFSF